MAQAACPDQQGPSSACQLAQVGAGWGGSPKPTRPGDGLGWGCPAVHSLLTSCWLCPWGSLLLAYHAGHHFGDGVEGLGRTGREAEAGVGSAATALGFFGAQWGAGSGSKA